MNIFSIIVTYHPDLSKLNRISQVLSHNNCTIIIVDNSEIGYDLDLLKNCTVFSLKNNFGIGYAQNIGIKHALQQGADVIVFFDQDSIIEENFLVNLLAPIRITEPMIVSPVFYDETKNFRFPSLKFGRFGFLKKVYNVESTPYEVDVIISSGSAVTKKVFEKVGLMNEDLFIDFVDYEWSIRCRNLKLPILAVPSAIMKHSIGEKSIDFLIFRGFIHSSTRSYYKLRNPFLLLREKHIPKKVAIKEIFSALIHQAVLIFFVRSKGIYIKNYFIAVFHGILGKKGKLLRKIE